MQTFEFLLSFNYLTELLNLGLTKSKWETYTFYKKLGP